MLPGSSLFPLARELYRDGLFGLRDVARVTADQTRFRLLRSERPDAIDRVRERTLAAIKGRSREALLAIARSVVHRDLVPRLYPRAVELVKLHRKAGRVVYLATSSPEDYAAILADALGMSGALGTRAEVIEGRFTGRLDGPLNHGRDKADRVRALAAEQGIDLERSVAFSDSINDLPMLDAVGSPVVVNPDRLLSAVAKRLDWPCWSFGRPARDATASICASHSPGRLARNRKVALRSTLRSRTTARMLGEQDEGRRDALVASPRLTVSLGERATLDRQRGRLPRSGRPLAALRLVASSLAPCSPGPTACA